MDSNVTKGGILRRRVDVITYLGDITDQKVAKLYDIAFQAKAAGSTEIHLHISSEGGSYSAGFAAYGFLQSIGIPKVAHILGDVKNAALPLFLAAGTRSMSGFAQILIEEVPHPYDFLRLTQLLSFSTNGKINLKPYGHNEPLTYDYETALKFNLTTEGSVMSDYPLDAVFWHVTST